MFSTYPGNIILLFKLFFFIKFLILNSSSPLPAITNFNLLSSFTNSLKALHKNRKFFCFVNLPTDK